MKRLTCEMQPTNLVFFYFEDVWIHKDINLAPVSLWCTEQGLRHVVVPRPNPPGVPLNWLDEKYPNCIQFYNDEDASLCYLRWV